MNTKNIKKQKISKLGTQKIACWVFCASITTETLKLRLWVKFILFGFLQPNTNNIRFWKITRIRIRILFGFEKSPECEYEYNFVLNNHPNTNTNIIWFWKITRIRIRILFGLKISSEYEYEYHYLVSTIRILFEYRIIRSPLHV